MSAMIESQSGTPLIHLWVDRGTPAEVERVCARPTADAAQAGP